jgi:hypothetical protein
VASPAALPGQLRAVLGFELATLSPRTVNLADCVATAERDDGRDGREYEHADRGDDLEHDDHSDDRHDHKKNCLHGSDYMTLKLSGSREFALRA